MKKKVALFVAIVAVSGCGIQPARGPIAIKDTPSRVGMTLVGTTDIPVAKVITHEECADWYARSVTAKGNRVLALATNCAAGDGSGS
jgi:hypothetical protein